MSFVVFIIILPITMSSNSNGLSSYNPPMMEVPVIDDEVIVGLPPTKPVTKGRHSWPTLEVVTKVKNKKGENVKVFSYPGLADNNNWKDKMLISVLAETTPVMKEFWSSL
jgi:hypothetical protein